MTEKELNNELIKWFKTINKDKNFWNRNPIAKTIKENLEAWGNFKGKERGNPPKAFRKKIYNAAVKNGYEGKFEG